MADNKKKGILSKYSVWDRKKFSFVYVILIYPVIHVLLFYFYVHIDSFLMAFQDTKGNWSFQSLERVFNGFFKGEDPVSGINLLEYLWKSLLIWVNGTIVTDVISLVIAFMLTKHMVGSKAFRVVYSIPGLVGGVVFSRIMQNIYAYNGPMIALLDSMGVELSNFVRNDGLLGAQETAYATLLTQFFIFGITGGSMIIAGAYMKVPEEIFESARMDGCGLVRECVSIGIPCIWPTFSTLLTFSLCGMFVGGADFYLYSNGTGANGLVSIGYYMHRLQVAISQNVGNNQYLFGFASAFGMVITMFTIPVVLIGKKILSKINDVVDF